MRIWDLAMKGPVAGGDLAASAGVVVSVAITPDNKTLVTADREGKIKVWSLADRKEQQTIKAHRAMQGTNSLAVSADGKRCLTAGADNAVRCWELATGKKLREWQFTPPVVENKGFIRSLVFSPDGRSGITANSDGTVYWLELP